MGDFNKVMVLGRLTRDPEVRYTPSGTPVCDIGIAVGRRIGGGDSGTERREETTYVDVTLWRRQAELAGQYLAKGREIFIEGRLEMDSWEDRNTGQKRTKLKVVCENMQFVGGGGGAAGGNRPAGGQQYGGGNNYQQGGGYQSAPAQNDGGYGGGYQSAPQQSYNQAPPQESAPMEPQFEPEDDDDIPF